ncbi:hydroxyisourate hydrolase [Pseudoduganella buxea]|uniref:5-hydroxyisourate hydrolase n=1 Tax=Pseudoduganella buxea TaxID=1949069 RepID=A0A6I3SWT4_9BURK|nr:hydroxyisourate hydrolase [Pseudoduganella buxea]MTV53165.1 hydroxyisourate hydrolase [Pseudoduganella buxea]GGC00179.1 5-hydroxyisourate hydrolase [Pseudoduganella buxea]
MNLIKLTLPLLAAFALHAHAAPATTPNPLSVHVLDLQTGAPGTDIAVSLEQQDGDQWRQLATGRTNEAGRIPALYPADRKLSTGTYRIVFRTGEHYKRLGKPAFFPQIPVEFTVDETSRHYHIPLLLSQFGYSTYRGN